MPYVESPGVVVVGTRTPFMSRPVNWWAIVAVGALAVGGLALALWDLFDARKRERRLQREIDALTTTVNDGDAALQTEITALTGSVTTLNSQVATLNGDVTTLNGEVATLNSQVTALNTHHTIIASMVTTQTIPNSFTPTYLHFPVIDVNDGWTTTLADDTTFIAPAAAFYDINVNVVWGASFSSVGTYRQVTIWINGVAQRFPTAEAVFNNSTLGNKQVAHATLILAAGDSVQVSTATVARAKRAHSTRSTQRPSASCRFINALSVHILYLKSCASWKRHEVACVADEQEEAKQEVCKFWVAA